MFVLLRRGQASVVCAYLFPIPIIASALGIALLGEPFHWEIVPGALAVSIAIWLVNAPRAIPDARPA